MALKLICDKCNKILSPADNIVTLTADQGPRRYDFCEKCYESFVNWYTSKEDSDVATECHIVTYMAFDGDEPIVTAFNNRENAKKFYNYISTRYNAWIDYSVPICSCIIVEPDKED